MIQFNFKTASKSALDWHYSSVYFFVCFLFLLSSFFVLFYFFREKMKRRTQSQLDNVN